MKTSTASPVRSNGFGLADIVIPEVFWIARIGLAGRFRALADRWGQDQHGGRRDRERRRAWRRGPTTRGQRLRRVTLAASPTCEHSAGIKHLVPISTSRPPFPALNALTTMT